MRETIIIGFIHNIAVLLAFAMLYENFWLKDKITKNLLNKIISGCIVGFIGIMLMLTPWQLFPGIIFDARSILLCITGLFLGPIPTIIAMFLLGLNRALIGGDGLWMGISIIFSSGTIGLLWRSLRPGWKQKNIYIELFSLGLIVHLLMLGLTFLLPSNEIYPTFKAIAIPLLFIYAPGTMLLGLLMVRQSNNYTNNLAKEKLDESEKRIAHIINSGNIASVTIDPYGIIVTCNSYLLDITHYTEQEVVGKYWFDLFIPLYARKDLMSVFEDALNGNNELMHIENEIIAKNGKSIFISWHFNQLIKDSNVVSGIAAIGINITERINYEMALDTKNKTIESQNIVYQRINEEYQQINEEYLQINEELNNTNLDLIRTKEKVEENDRLKSAFLANMSHEIRTPMNGILGFADLLKEPDLTGEEHMEYVNIIEKSGQRMLNIINDLIDISKIESGQMEITISETNINEQIEYIYNFFKPEVERKGMEIAFRTGLPDNEANFYTDCEKLYAILTNLVKNAIKYSDKGKIELSYHLQTQISRKGETKELMFHVKDTGLGIPEEKLEIIFDRFVQADVADKRATEGAGLGLSITKAYIEMLGGIIWVESEEGEGTIFYFTLPFITQQTTEKKTVNEVDTQD